jgi:dTDP-4-dehydrorhamnose 3,5-epimerase-like enzyme
MKIPWKIVDLHVHNFDSRKSDLGQLVSVRVREITSKRVSFSPEVYCIFAEASPSIGHGRHGHREKYEIMIPLSGKVNVILHSEGACGEEILNNRTKGLLIPPGVWHELYLENGSILLVLSSSLYDRNDYFYALPCRECNLLKK